MELETPCPNRRWRRYEAIGLHSLPTFNQLNLYLITIRSMLLQFTQIKPTFSYE